MSRAADWPTQLAVYLTSVKGKPFAWAENDCCTFAAGAVLAITGVDHLGPYRGKYATAKGATRILTKAGGLHGWVVKCLGEPLARPALAQRGDVVLFETQDTFGPAALGICVGAQIAAPGPDRMVLVPLTLATAAWRV
jgi:hypothetical protein